MTNLYAYLIFAFAMYITQDDSDGKLFIYCQICSLIFMLPVPKGEERNIGWFALFFAALGIKGINHYIFDSEVMPFVLYPICCGLANMMAHSMIRDKLETEERERVQRQVQRQADEEAAIEAQKLRQAEELRCPHCGIADALVFIKEKLINTVRVPEVVQHQAATYTPVQSVRFGTHNCNVPDSITVYNQVVEVEYKTYRWYYTCPHCNNKTSKDKTFGNSIGNSTF